MKITSRDDGIVRTHEEARALFERAVPGARVRIERTPLRAWNQNRTEAERAYQITVMRFGAPVACVTGCYSLPAPADQLARHALEQVTQAMR